ncbi:alanine racemase [Anaerotignum sp. MSJ-24]|uniref:alanine racemase n=1 Tax=Anaerotignum sp. MSJ-24 TaxID=2841521 RepID=UPI001C106BDF|nr:alanine racemase [Anaerotignum sp. MSJ-24]MBU5463086.1 alanine racemase [Anaerotignum sp. MSJ-24]
MTDEERVLALIDLDALEYNIKSIRKKTPEGTGIIGVIKADAYGHGSVEVAQVLLENGADWFAVAVVDEGLNLRKHGINAPILLLGYTPELRFEDVINNGFIQTMYSYEMAEKLSKTAVRLGKTAVVHIKIDTGMGRIGYRVNDEAADEIVRISKLPGIEVNGMFTHFAASDEADKAYTNMQFERFMKMDKMLKDRGLNIPVRHAANSAAIMDIDSMMLNMVRPGIILYGAYPSDEVVKENLDLRPVMSIKTHVSFVKEVEKGDCISYGRTYTAPDKRKIATIPVGYADGFIRAYAKDGKVLIKGKFAPIVGRICMDQFMVDVTDIDDVKINDEVVLMGTQGENSITADDIAKALNTINYEVFCTLSKRVPRQYIRNGKVTETVKYV